MNRSAHGLDDIRDLSPRDFELLIADIWQECQGWTTELTDTGADDGIDIYGRPPGGGPLTAVQAKRYRAGNKVTSNRIQQYGALPQQFDRIGSVTVVTTSSFTRNAEQTAKKLDVKVIDGKTLLQIIERYGAHEIVEWYCQGKPKGGL